ncbi:Golgi-associated kinase 1A [Pygocentrus nattereri]|uniref:Golgi associated kinase 1A n=1 Tax=Pygocentrus nattereri TaxID=42514 RepID=A0A3B4CYC4_PYGNA|nr:Golgi-associated kinase 1A [Pygocentrus nattereri]
MDSELRRESNRCTRSPRAMGLRARLKLRVKWRYIVASLSLLVLSAVMINTHSPSPSQQKRLLSRWPLHNYPTGLKRMGPKLPLHQLPSNGHSGIWKFSKSKDSAKHQLVVGYHQHRGSNVHEKVQQATKKKMKNSAKRTFTKSKQSKRKHMSQTFTVSEKLRFAKKTGNGSDSKYAIQLLLPRPDQTIPKPASMQSLHPDIKPCRHKCTPDGSKPEKLVGKSGELKWGPRKTKTHERQAKPAEKKRHHFLVENNSISGAGAEGKDYVAGWCETSHSKAFSESLNWTKAESLPWLSRDDVEKMHLLAKGTVLSKARIPGHGQVLQVGLGGHNDTSSLVGDHSRLCQTGNCALIKRPSDWFEVFAFHLDRILGLNRSLPAVLRIFHSNHLPYKYTNGSPRPVVWWDPDIQHLDDDDNDQNSFSLTWPQYQALLKSKCGMKVPLNSSGCVGVHNSEWARLALFDFLLQVNDRLDRYCCGFRPDPADMCVENLLNVKCANPKDLMLVHILVRGSNPSRLVFIDNAGRPHHQHDNLNFRLVEGIDEFPERAIRVLQSGCLEQLLLRSLSVDKELWESRGGVPGLRATIHTIQQRARALLQHLQEKKLNTNMWN